ncbi:MAG: DNA polymerase III subunit delta' [Rhodothalassiaceae bacterium]
MSAADLSGPEHPRRTLELIGHEAAEQSLRQAGTSGRLHHGWLLTGPRGVGKATLAYRFARFLLARPVQTGPSLFAEPEPWPDSLAMAPEHPVAQRVAAASHGNLAGVERAWDDKGKRRYSEIRVDDIRRMARHFATTAAEGGWRVAVIDSADEMNRSAANALLKLLEEPPASTVLLLVSHAPGRLLPTIRSRCRRLMLSPLSREQVAQVLRTRLPDLTPSDAQALAALSDGAPGRALALAEAGGLGLYRSLIGSLAGLPDLDGVAVHKLAGDLAVKANEERCRLFLDLLFDWTASLVRAGAAGHDVATVTGDEPALAQKLLALAPPAAWLELWEQARRAAATAQSLHLDRKQLVLSLMGAYQAVASGQPSPLRP